MVVEGGGTRVTAIDAGSLRLDGGAMFGVVPRPLWERQAPPDERNRIHLAMRCLLVQTSDLNVLVDTGLGNKETDRFRDIYGVSNVGSPTRLEDSLTKAGVAPDEIDVVINTHLHFDHAGGNTVAGADGSVSAAFANARYIMSEGELAFARSDNERARASYLPANYEPLVEDGQVELLSDGAEIVPGIRYVHTRGHTPHHQSVLVDLGDARLLYLADLAPTRAHLPLPWIMGYDLEPMETLESKRALLTRAAQHEWFLAFEHDPSIAWGRAVALEDGADGCSLADEIEQRCL
jgi:glyoxylase-like metal-dependent hydrolase (beta-lactamase superfamily II)